MITQSDIIFEDFSIKVNPELEIIKESEQILNEMHFSKKDLQDPNFIEKKIINPAEKFKSTGEVVSECLAAIIAVVIGTVTVGPLGIIPGSLIGLASGAVTLSTLSNIISNSSSNFVYKNKMKYYDKFNALEENCKKIISENKNPKQVEEAKKILQNLEKVRKIWKEKEDEASKKEYQTSYDFFEKVYKRSIDFINGKYESDDFNPSEGEFIGGNMFAFLTSKQIGMTPEKYFQILETKYKNKFKTLSDTYVKDNLDEKDNLKFIKPDDKIYLIYLNNDIESYYDARLKKIIVSDSAIYSNKDLYTPSQFAKTFIYDEMKEFFDEMKILKDVDKDLGYYKFSECPKNIEQKPFPKF